MAEITDNAVVVADSDVEVVESQIPAYYTLTRRQQLFVDAYVKCKNGSQAIRATGFTGRRPGIAAWKIKQSPAVRRAIADRETEAAEAAGLTNAQVLLDVMDVVRRCRQEVPVVDKDGKPTGVYAFDAANALRGLDFLGRHLKLWGSDKVEHVGRVVHQFERRSAKSIPPEDAARSYQEMLSLAPPKKQPGVRH